MSFNNEDPVIICPYDGNHKIARSRIQRHLTKCEKNFPPNFKKQCPYDATHRVFEHQLVEHVKNCPMKDAILFELAQSEQITVQKENEVHNDGEIWDEDVPDDSIAEQSFDQKSDMLVVKRYGKKLRRPFGYSESLLVETADMSCLSTDEDVHSVMSEMGIGRGRSIPSNSTGQHQRGTNHSFVRGIRGRLLPRTK